MDRKKELLIRAYFVLLCFVLYALLIAFRVVNISVVEGEKWREKGGHNVKWMQVEAERGNIYDKNGNLLATSLPFFEIRMDLLVPRKDLFNKDIDSLSLCLANFFPKGKSAAEWKSELVNKRRAGQNKEPGSRYHFIAKNLSYDQVQTLRKYPIFREGRARGGFIVEKESRRQKPFKELASRTIGKYSKKKGNKGLEKNFDTALRGESEQKLMKKIPPGFWVPVYEPSEIDNAKGDDIVTTLDVHFQDIVHEELLGTLEKYSAEKGCAILMEVSTGAIRAVSNLERLKSGKYVERWNHAIATSSEPGSTLKLASALALLESKYADLHTKVDLQGGKKKFFDIWMHDSEPHGKREVTFKDAFILSSNVGIATLTARAFNRKDRREDFVNYYRKFGLTDKTDISIVGEPAPLIKDPVKDKHNWYATTIPWMSHGYEMMMTPLQILSFYNTVANKGKRMKPYLVTDILRNGSEYKSFKPTTVIESIASESSIDKVHQMLVETVTRGTGKRVSSTKVEIAGKTGTTKVEYGKDKDSKKYNASFAGYFPASAPKYSLIVIVYKPKESYYGGVVAGPAFKRIAERVAAKEVDIQEFADIDHIAGLGYQPENVAGYSKDFQELMQYLNLGFTKRTKSRWVNIDSEQDNIVIRNEKIKKTEVPDVRGMGLRDAVYVLENLGMQVQVKGYGIVHNQSIKPGIKNKGQEIELFLH